MNDLCIYITAFAQNLVLDDFRERSEQRPTPCNGMVQVSEVIEINVTVRTHVVRSAW